MRKTLYLKEGWKLNYTSFGNEITEDSNGWIDAKVPGDVHIDLFKAGEKTEFFYGLNADLWRWVEDKDFWYRNKFIIPEISKDEVCYLIFEGIDTFAEIYINGRTVKTSENMFLPVEVDITNFCKKSREIKLAVKISSPIYSLNMKDKKVNDWNPARIFVRKSQFNYGWDIAPRLISCGIWRPVKIEIYNSGRINDVYIKTERIEKDLVILKGNVELEFFKNFKNNRVKVELFEDSCEERKEKIYEISKKVENKNLNFKVELKNPKLWWPNDIGEQNLYSYCVNFYRGDEIVDKKEGDFGIKKIELIQKKMNNRKTFYFRINGVDIFIKGFNWTPCDVFPARVSEEKYEKLLNLVKETGANMLRVWGGGIYETELFYKICDKYGIMVWQDFMFACSGYYPEDKNFIENVKKEAEYIIRKLRNHPSICLWSGGNENDSFRYWMVGKKYTEHKIGRKVLKKLCEKYNKDIPFIPDSPFSPSGDDPNSDKEGDCHLWAHGKSYRDEYYIKKNPMFISEIGHLSVPDKETLLKFIPEDKLWPVFNEYWYYHSSDTLRDGWKFRIASLFQSIKNNNLPEPKNLEELIETTQKLQADAYAFWTEFYYKQPYCGGILLWNVCDCWYQISDSIICFDLKPKIAYYKIKEIYKKLSPFKKYE